MWKLSVTSIMRGSRVRLGFTCLKRMSSTGSDSEDVLFKSVNNKGVIILNRPKALNALNTSMCNKIFPKMKEWECEKKMVIIKGAGEKAFCAGGDVKSLAQEGLKGNHVGKEFFRREYTLNNLIGTYSIPYIALIDGITMGGGVGLSVHGHYRVATERTLFAMPETAIGLFPDVGGSYFLPRLGGKLGLYLALTGHRLKGKDNLKAGIATHYCESTRLTDLENALLECANPEKEAEGILNSFTKESEGHSVEFSLAPYLKQIDQIFSAPTVEEILVRLEKDGSEWAIKTLTTLRQMSPTSMKVTKRELDEGVNKTLQECLIVEYRLGVHACEGHDFYEGVKALLIDKGRKPEWKPATLEEVTPEFLDKHFAPLAPEDELKL
ncbi:3-hydroxyisobutyryl-CoA hydrolase, mitochondrial [Anabrus simplex]|uniref:3-hydroxyisobutyryl-CoA hydrolase, mitochondrial n=1 Tax=Anabrus simplex TaxID=316456 RepID=UPI0035A31C04